MLNQNEPEPKPDVIPGDDVFFKHPTGDVSGRVVSTGKHGVQIQCGKKTHRVKWDAVLAHKRRAPQHYQIAEHGEDGHLVQDEAGRKRFMAIPAESRADPWIVKALSTTPQRTRPTRGHRVQFKDKDMSSSVGVIVGRPGKDGAHVRDDNGKIHPVEWQHIKKARSGATAS